MTHLTLNDTKLNSNQKCNSKQNCTYVANEWFIYHFSAVVSCSLLLRLFSVVVDPVLATWLLWFYYVVSICYLVLLWWSQMRTKTFEWLQHASNTEGKREKIENENWLPRNKCMHFAYIKSQIIMLFYSFW